MTKKQKMRLVKQIASAAERAYRRGFQHGVHSGASERDAYMFRYEEISAKERGAGLITQSIPAPWKSGRGCWECSAVERLKMEVEWLDSYKDLVRLILDAE